VNVDATVAPRIRDDLLRRDLDLQAVIWSPTRRDPVSLDPVVTVIADLIDGSATVADLVEDIQEVVGVPTATAESQVARALSALQEAGALVSAMPEQPAERQRELFLNPPSH
jgi:hypothetical protein